MNTVTIAADRLVVEPQGLDRLWSMHGRIDVPLSHVVGATVDPGISAEPKGVRAPGLAVPGRWAGTFHHDGERSFWNVTASGGAVVVRLRDDEWDQLVLTVQDPAAVVRAVNAAAG